MLIKKETNLILLGGNTLAPLLKLTYALRPVKVYYLTSKDPSVVKTFNNYKKRVGNIVSEIEFFPLDEPLFDSIYQALLFINKKYKDQKFYIGITGGKKTMTSAAAIFAYQNKERYKLIYTDFKNLDGKTNLPKDKKEVFITEINLDLPLLISIDKQEKENKIYIFNEGRQYHIYFQKDNFGYKIEKSDINSLLPLLKNADVQYKEIYKDNIENIFHFNDHKRHFSEAFTFYIDKTLIKIPFEVSPIFNRMKKLRIIDNSVKPLIEKEKFLTILYDKNYLHSRKEALEVKNLAQNFNINYKFIPAQDVNLRDFIFDMERSSIVHYSGHIGRNGIRFKDGLLTGNNLKNISNAPEFMFLNGCEALTGGLLNGIITSNIKTAMGPIFPISDSIPIDYVKELYTEFFEGKDYNLILNNFVRKMKNEGLYYRVYYG